MTREGRRVPTDRIRAYSYYYLRPIVAGLDHRDTLDTKRKDRKSYKLSYYVAELDTIQKWQH
jgi:hypothetical protein